MVGGQLFTYCLGPYVSVSIFNFVSAIFPALFLILFTLLGEETPYYYIRIGEYKLAKETLKKFRSTANDEELEIENDLSMIQRKMEEQSKGTLLDIFRSKGLIKALIMAEGLLLLQQLTGVNAVLFYSQTIFSETVSGIDAEVCSIIIGAVHFVCSFIAPLILDRLNRTFLLLVSTIGLMACETLLGVYSYLKHHGENVDSWSFLPIITLTLYMIFFMAGMGPMPWFILAEIFPVRLKTIVSSSVACTNWMLGFFVTKYFGDMKDAIGLAQSFWIFAGCCALGALFIKFYVIETRGKSLEEIQDILNK
ncbi:hypothetical protein NQ314_021197 [Rhamnusium bicolor]|uniref:Major facilitator superfamily (MFS) profile domain-containing protein n=1 Tax=Rhamnusium bicolor TaxID=1586634 RepID=A0AAV8WKS8_9CUCU|nr:hypothetical protein NQ314_021197 [Rhamnusium bicolor]